MGSENELITVGEVINTQGIKGELKIWPHTDFPERFKIGDVVMWEKDGLIKPLTIEKVRQHKNVLIIKFEGTDDMNSAEILKGGLLKVNREDLTELPPDTYYLFDIIGLDVKTDEGIVLGQVKDVIQTGGNDVYVVQGEHKDYLIPAIKEIVRKIDVINKVIIIQPLAGLLEL